MSVTTNYGSVENPYDDHTQPKASPKPPSPTGNLPFTGNRRQPTAPAGPQTAFNNLNAQPQPQVPQGPPLGDHRAAPVTSAGDQATAAASRLQRASGRVQHVASNENYGRAAFIGDYTSQAQHPPRAASPAAQPMSRAAQPPVGNRTLNMPRSAAPPSTITLGKLPYERQIGANATKDEIEKYKARAIYVKDTTKTQNLPKSLNTYKKAQVASNAASKNSQLSKYEKSTHKLIEQQANHGVKSDKLIIANRHEQTCYADWLLAEKALTSKKEILSNLKDPKKTPSLSKQERQNQVHQAEKAVTEASKSVGETKKAMKTATAVYQKAREELIASTKTLREQSMATLKVYENECSKVQKQLKKRPIDENKLKECITTTAVIARKMRELRKFNERVPFISKDEKLRGQQVRILELLKSPAETLYKQAQASRGPIPSTKNPTPQFYQANSSVREADVAQCLIKYELSKLQSDETVQQAAFKLLYTALKMKEANQAALNAPAQASPVGNVGARQPPAPLAVASPAAARAAPAQASPAGNAGDRQPVAQSPIRRRAMAQPTERAAGSPIAARAAPAQTPHVGNAGDSQQVVGSPVRRAEVQQENRMARPSSTTTRTNSAEASQGLDDLLAELGEQTETTAKSATPRRKLTQDEERSWDDALALLEPKEKDPVSLLDDILAEFDAAQATTSTSAKFPLSPEENSQLQAELTQAAKHRMQLQKQVDESGRDKEALQEARSREAKLVVKDLKNMVAEINFHQKILNDLLANNEDQEAIDAYKNFIQSLERTYDTQENYLLDNLKDVMPR